MASKKQENAGKRERKRERVSGRGTIEQQVRRNHRSKEVRVQAVFFFLPFITLKKGKNEAGEKKIPTVPFARFTNIHTYSLAHLHVSVWWECG